MQKMNTERYDAYRREADGIQASKENYNLVCAQLAVAEAVMLVAEQLEKLGEIQEGKL